jgi:lipopolysaccharide/colanic/teichoic acid biosynthesis glycosyltransferase
MRQKFLRGLAFAPLGSRAVSAPARLNHWRRRSPRAGDSELQSLTKRLLDVGIAVTLLVVLAPLLVLLALAVKLDSRGPVFYRCRRVGLAGREFAMLKLRKMRHDAAGSALTSARDERFTRIGSFLARTKLDELPQLWNVIRGDMSLVGPRPEDPRFVALYRQEFAEILRAKPGITGLSQLAFSRESLLLDGPDPERHYVGWLLPQKTAIDRFYVTARSMTMDLRILAWTIVAVAFGIEVAVDRQSGALSFGRRLHAEPASQEVQE